MLILIIILMFILANLLMYAAIARAGQITQQEQGQQQSEALRQPRHSYLPDYTATKEIASS